MPQSPATRNNGHRNPSRAPLSANVGAADLMMSAASQPLIKPIDVIPKPSADGFVVERQESSVPAFNTDGDNRNSSRAASATALTSDGRDVFDQQVEKRMMELNKPDWASFNAAIASKDVVNAWILFKDILLFDDSQHGLVTLDHFKSVLQLLRSWKPKPKILFMQECLQFANDLKVVVDTDVMNIMAGAYARDGDYDKARDVVVRMGEKGLAPNLRTYNLFLEFQLRDENLQGAVAFYERMIDEGIEPDVETFNILIQGCIKLSKANLVESFFKEMLALGIEPDQRTLAQLIRYHSKMATGLLSSTTNGSTEVSLTSTSSQTKSTTPTASTTMHPSPLHADAPINKAALESVDKEVAEATVATLQNLVATYITPGHVQSNAVIDTALIEAYSRASRLDLAQQTFDACKTRYAATSNPEDKPDAYMYTTMIRAYANHTRDRSVSMHARAVALMEEMLADTSLELDSVAFANLVHMFVAQGDMENAEAVAFVGMKGRAVPVTVSVWAALVHGHLDGRQTTDAVRVFESMKMEGVSPPTYVYNALLKGLAEDFDMELLERHWARWLWSIEVEEKASAVDGKGMGQPKPKWKKRSMVSKPDAASYQIVVDAFLACQDVPRARKEVERMIQARFTPPTKTFVALMEAYVRGRDYQAAVETMLLMRGVIASESGTEGLKAIIKTHSAQFESLAVHLLSKSEELVLETEEMATHATAPVLSTSQRDKFRKFAEEAPNRLHEMQTKRVLGVELYKEMLAAGCTPNEETFKCVIKANTRAKDLMGAIKAWYSFRSLSPNLKPQNETVNALLECVSTLGRQSSARAVVDIVKQEELPLDAEGFGLLLSLLARWGWKEELISTVFDIVNSGTPLTPVMVQGVLQNLKDYKGIDAQKVEREVIEFLEENWPETLLLEDEEVKE
ncbi:hypothetical protein BC830DRAFT_1076284 [Chytriomyces sp. MP71]|nr:hypothetical protein BC830DRAFT_1076284 [Chytriomyces sp. MP71]